MRSGLIPTSYPQGKRARLGTETYMTSVPSVYPFERGQRRSVSRRPCVSTGEQGEGRLAERRWFSEPSLLECPHIRSRVTSEEFFGFPKISLQICRRACSLFMKLCFGTDGSPSFCARSVCVCVCVCVLGKMCPAHVDRKPFRTHDLFNISKCLKGATS